MDKYLLFCEPCAYKQIIKDPEEFAKIKRAEVPRGVPKKTPEDKTEQKYLPQPIMAKCPRCGRGVIIKRMPEPYVKTDREIKAREQKQKEKERQWRQENP